MSANSRPDGTRCYRNKLVSIWWFGIGLSAGALVFFSLVAASAALHKLSFWWIPGSLLVGVAIAVVWPLSSPRRNIPNYLVMDSAGAAAIFGKAEHGKKIPLDRYGIKRLEGGGPVDVLFWCQTRGPPGTVLQFMLSNEAFPLLDAFRRGEGTWNP
jgi:hypothetical protein